MKRYIALALSLMMTLTLLAGCAGAAPSSEAPSSNPGTPAPSSSVPAGEVKLTVLDESLQSEEYGIAFKKGNKELYGAVMSTLDEMQADGTSAKISDKWFGKDVVLKGEAVAKTKLPASKTKFVVGLDDSFPPIGFRNDKNEIVGFDVDLATEVAKRLGLELVLQPIDWSAKELELDSGNIDVIWNGLTITDARKEAMLLSRPYLANNQVIVVPEGSAIKGKADLEGKKVAVQTGSSGEEALDKDPVAAKIASKIQMGDYVSAFQDLKTGRIDAVIVDEVVARYYVSNN